MNFRLTTNLETIVEDRPQLTASVMANARRWTKPGLRPLWNYLETLAGQIGSARSHSVTC
jgi:hypothetical protein